MDIFYEQIVAKQNTTVDILKKVGLILAAFLLAFIILFILPGLPVVGPFIGSFGLLLVVGECYGVWYLLSSMNIEYEYILTNGEIDIDKIIARRKRKRLITVNTRTFTEMGRYQPEKVQGRTFSSTIMACTRVDAPDCWYAVMDHPKHGNCLLIFNPNEHIMDGIKQYVKRNVLKDQD